jgi:DNA-binding response OmpR family regulator
MLCPICADEDWGKSRAWFGMAKVLIADDSRFQGQLLASYLTPKGFEAIYALDALQAWTAALRSAPELILLDINMPGGTGIEVLKRLRMSTKTQHIPVIVVSGEENPATETMARSLGAVDFLHKPVEEGRLGAAVDRALHRDAHAAK